jgi:kynurenine formamidase
MDRRTRIVDLSVPLATGMPVYPGDPEVRIEPALRLDRGDGVNVLALHMGSQSGTHLDAPYHVIDGSTRLDALPLERFVGSAVVADVRHVGARSAIGLDDLAPIIGSLSAGVVLLLHTGWSRHWGDQAIMLDHPWLAPDAAAAVVAAGVRTVGIDALSVDPSTAPEQGAPTGLDAHLAILGSDGVIVENLTNLEALAGLAAPVVSVLPLRIPRSDGAPVRAVAWERATFG